MTERLTEDGFCISEECEGHCNICDYMRKMLEKLSHYEDLEEQGRLVVLPEGFDKDTFSKHLALTACPAFVGLKDWQGTEKCKDTTECCKECWNEALKEDSYES